MQGGDDRSKDRDERDISTCVPILDKPMEPQHPVLDNWIEI